jgi:hypothetical protein
LCGSVSSGKWLESAENILDWSAKQDEKSAVVTRNDIKNYHRKVWKFEALWGWVDSFISGYSAELTE